MRYVKHGSDDPLCDWRDTLLGRISLERAFFDDLQLSANFYSVSINMPRFNFDILDRNNDKLRQHCIHHQFSNHLCTWCLYSGFFRQQLSSGYLHCSSQPNNSFWHSFHPNWNYLVCANSDRSRLPLSNNYSFDSGCPYLQCFCCSRLLRCISALYVQCKWISGMRKH